MLIAGIVKSSVIDYPGTICTVIFTGGCNLRCGYCHNPELINFAGFPLSEAELFDFLERRRKFIDAVCISGGEPCIQAGLYEFIEAIKVKGFKVKLDTNGTRPDVLERLINSRLLDYIAMDVKATFDKYHSVTGAFVDVNAVKKSIRLIKSFDGEYEFRTTVCKPLIDKDDLIDIAKVIKGAKRYYLQRFKESKKADFSRYKYTSYGPDELEDTLGVIKDWFDICTVRG